MGVMVTCVPTGGSAADEYLLSSHRDPPMIAAKRLRTGGQPSTWCSYSLWPYRSVSLGCVPLVPEGVFLRLASDFALDPTKTCDELKEDFNVPRLTTVADPGGIGLEFEEAYVANAAGHLLRVWYIPNPESRGTIVLSNGAVGEIACYLLIPLMLHGEGWSFVMYDFQGFGGSGGTANLVSLYGDLGAVLDLDARKRRWSIR